MSSLLTNLSHPSDTMTLSTLRFLSPSDWVPPWRDPRTPHIILFSLRNRLIYVPYLIAKSQRSILKCTNGIMHGHGCKDEHKTFNDEIVLVYSSLIIWSCLAVCVVKPPGSRMWSHVVSQVKEKDVDTTTGRDG